MKILSFLLFTFPYGLFAQNLVINSDFESKSGCPYASGQFILADEWFSPNTGTPDYFNDCSPTLEYGTEYNSKGGQIPHSGHGYMGILSENLHNNNFFEYLETHWKEPLKNDQLYCIKLYISLGDCDFALRSCEPEIALIKKLTSFIPLSSLKKERGKPQAGGEFLKT